MSDEKEQWRNTLKDLLKRVPQSINSASIDTVRAYKKAVVAALKALDNNNTPVIKLEGFVNQLRQYK